MRKILSIFIAFAVLVSFVYFIYGQSYAQQSLGSNYFRNDATAQDILLGHPFSINGAINQDGTLSTNSFALKFLNGLRQVGYTGVSSLLPVTESSPLAWLHKFQRINNLSQSDNIGSAELLKLDNLVSAREPIDAQLAASLPLSNIVPGSLTEPSSNHVAALLTIALQSLPSPLAKWNSNNISDYIRTQGPGGDAGGIQYTTRGVCFLNYFPSLDSQCNSTNATIVPGLIKDDPSLVYNILHEYAHYLDGKMYASAGSDSSKGAIDTQGFNAISFDTSVNCNPSSSWRFFKLRNPSNERNEFVTAYATGYTATGDENCKSSIEDFAESFAMYVMQGNTFRKLAETKPVIAQKYAWLKNNAFAGKEYFTGNADNIPAVNQALTAPYMPSLPTFIDYLTINQAFVWDYQLAGSAPVVAPPTPTPTPTPICYWWMTGCQPTPTPTTTLTPTPTPTPTCYWWEGQCQPTPIPTLTPTPTPAPTTSRVEVVRFSGDPKVYVAQGSVIKWVPNPDVFNSLGLNWASIEVIPPSQKTNFQRAKLLRAENDEKVYYITEGGLKRHIPNVETFNSYGNLWQDVVVVKDFELSAIADSQLIRQTGDSKVYKLENGQKRWIKTAEAFNHLGLNWTQIAPVNSVEISSYAEGSAVE